MRIGMNLFPLNSRGGGMRHYVMQLIPQLLKLSPHEFILFYRVQGLPSLAAVLHGLSAADRSRLQMVEIEDQEQIFGYADSFDTYFCPLNGFAPNLLDRPTLGTLADIQDQYFPQYFTAEQLDLRRRLYPYMARAVTTLLTISEFSKRSICETYDIPASKVRVTYLAPSDDVAQVKADWPGSLPPLPRRFVFYPANLYPHKNHELLLQAIRYIRKTLGIDCACVMTGHEVSPGIAIKERIKANDLTGIAHWLGHVPRGALRYLYENAAALAFPSQFEGFGMPLVEAMQCRCPVVATPTTCIPEIVGDAGLLVRGTPEEFGQAIARLLHEPGTRDGLIAKGAVRAARFTAEATARGTLAAIEDAPTKFLGSDCCRENSRIAYVVRPLSGEESLVRSLASVALQARDTDEVLVLAKPGNLSAKALALADNMDHARFIRDSIPWIDQINHEIVCFIEEGERLAPGAAAGAAAVLPAQSSCRAVVGQAIAVDSRGKYLGACLVPERLAGKLAVAKVPHAAAFWRRSYLASRRQILERPSWAAELLSALGSDVALLERTFVFVDRLDSPSPAPSLPASGNKRVRSALGAAVRSAGWSLCARTVMRWKTVLKKAAGFMPRPIESRLRTFYLRRIQPFSQR